MRLMTFPLQDATIYEEFPTRNTGLDEILEVGKTNDGLYRVRAMLKFDVTSVSASLATGAIPATAQFDLELSIANGESLVVGQVLDFLPISQSWVEGSGYFYQETIQSPDGTTWNSRSSGSSWSVTGSATINSTLSTSLTNPLTDVRLDITQWVMSWVSGTLPNNGIEIQFGSGSEEQNDNWGNVKFFSKDTHTIYSPVLVTKWNDQTRSTGSLTPSPTTDLFVLPSTLKTTYRQNDVVRVNVAARKRYPVKTFTNQFSQYDGLNYLPSSSYFSVVDDLSGKTVIPFDDASRLSCDSEGNYFVFRVQNMYPQRYYRVLIKVEHNGQIDTFDNGYSFTVK
jgi:hypothetical protein